MGSKFCGRGRNVMEGNIKLNQLKSGLDTAFVDYTHNSRNIFLDYWKTGK